MLMREGTFYEYVVNTWDPVIDKYLLSKDSYFYHLCLLQRYASNSPDHCPSYLTEGGFRKLKTSQNLHAIQIHTGTILNVLTTKVREGELTKAVMMDHLDWFTAQEARDEIAVLSSRMKRGGQVLWRSASKVPWYNAVFVEYGFEVKPVMVRLSRAEKGEVMRCKNNPSSDSPIAKEWLPFINGHCAAECIDRVNMYASFWCGTKV